MNRAWPQDMIDAIKQDPIRQGGNYKIQPRLMTNTMSLFLATFVSGARSFAQAHFRPLLVAGCKGQRCGHRRDVRGLPQPDRHRLQRHLNHSPSYHDACRFQALRAPGELRKTATDAMLARINKAFSNSVNILNNFAMTLRGQSGRLPRKIKDHRHLH